MVNTRRSQKLKLQAAQENTTKRSLAPAEKDFIWTTERKIALFQSMIRRKPAGLNKHINMLLIKTDLSKRLEMDVPIKQIWRFLRAHWDMDEVDRIEFPRELLKKKDFDLPKTEEWAKLIKEQGEVINALEKRKAEAKEEARLAAASKVELKTVKIMLERLDCSLYAHQLNNI